ncbi:MAG TPA: hypothetical protein VMU84_17725 [Thermoanaerobaculia bacterium]|nr:hypothetical protein [Thermoanaerobaculia bacterium]
MILAQRSSRTKPTPVPPAKDKKPNEFAVSAGKIVLLLVTLGLTALAVWYSWSAGPVIVVSIAILFPIAYLAFGAAAVWFIEWLSSLATPPAKPWTFEHRLFAASGWPALLVCVLVWTAFNQLVVALYAPPWPEDARGAPGRADAHRMA